MLEPRGTDIPILFLVFVFLPLVIYILLGKWNEATQRKERISLLADHVPREALVTEPMVADVVSVPTDFIHQCARCYAPATTRCSKCKSVRYCSGKCQIIHWRQVHKHECQLLGNSSSLSLKNNLDALKIGGGQLDAPNCSDTSNSLNSERHRTSSFDPHTKLIDAQILPKSCNPDIGEMTYLNCSTERNLTKKINKAKAASDSPSSNVHKSPKQTVKTRENDFDRDNNGQTADELKIGRIKDSVTIQRSNGISSKGIMRMIGYKKSSKIETGDPSAEEYMQKKFKMLFPYEDFIRFFQYQALDLLPRGLVNCGNSCYANAVLQCLTCTKPLTIYLLRRSHTSSCCTKQWCLMCELERHVSKLLEYGGPLSPSRIISHVRRTNRQIGDGSQEDAHEFLRFLVCSMQSICLEGLGGENTVDIRLQETTFIQHTFGGCLRSRVKCLKCNHESERYENIMDLTLEIYGWVETLEDALTQFTSPENLDGENMYRCGRCVTYVRALKQLSIQKAPNVLTIVLKRFEEGNYGKINKCITFPEMLNMIPFMSGKDDVPPLYMLYAVVVHLDTLNASFSGHYIAYVKDLQGNWFKIDDSEVQLVSVNQVMSEGAYILFYMRSSPRPPRTSSRKGANHQELRRPSRTEKSSRSEVRKSKATGEILNRNRRQPLETYTKSIGMEFSDTTSSDRSLFTSSDEASFTTESTRDSFSTIDYSEAGNADPISSMFNTVYASEYSSHRTVACSMFSGSKPQTRFFTESKGLVGDSNVEQRVVPCGNDLCNDTNCRIHVRYGNIHLDGHQTF